jgi:hypothetical protein
VSGAGGVSLDGRPRHDRRSPRRMRAEDTVVGQQRATGRGDERGEPLEELQGVQQQRRGAITPRPAQLIEELAARALGQSLERQRRTEQVSAEVFEAVAAVGGDGDIGVQAEALKAGAAWGARSGRCRGAEPRSGWPARGPRPNRPCRDAATACAQSQGVCIFLLILVVVAKRDPCRHSPTLR